MAARSLIETLDRDSRRAANESGLVRLLRYWHTLRHLRPVQVYGRAWFKLRKPRPDVRPAPPRRSGGELWQWPARRRASLIGADDFVLLNKSGRVAAAPDWNCSEHDKLWLYNLHYFDDLNAIGAAARGDWHRDLIVRWMAENPPGEGNGWEPYPLSLRIVNWIKWALSGNAPRPGMLDSLAVQVRALNARLEWHLLGNHLFVNAKALIFAGVFFEGGEADAWRRRGLAVLAREIPEQVLADGGHFELSTMYHALILEDLLDLCNLATAYPGVIPVGVQASWHEAAERMRTWLATMSHPDGEIAFFNDAAFGIAPEPSEIDDYARRLGCGPVARPEGIVTHLAPSGYIRLARGDAVALIDVARIGPDYLPGHAHADTLSFELSLFGQRVIVNSGTSVYGTGQERLRQRATAAHSTVEVDGENSSEVWGGFRVARRARPFDLAVSAIGKPAVVSCAHDGYCRLPGRVVHRREWRLGERSLVVKDRLEGGPHSAIARFFLHPHAKVVAEGAKGTFELGDGRVVRWYAESGEAALGEGTWHPEFGKSLATQSLELRFTRACVFSVEW